MMHLETYLGTLNRAVLLITSIKLQFIFLEIGALIRIKDIQQVNEKKYSTKLKLTEIDTSQTNTLSSRHTKTKEQG